MIDLYTKNETRSRVDHKFIEMGDPLWDIYFERIGETLDACNIFSAIFSSKDLPAIKRNMGFNDDIVIEAELDAVKVVVNHHCPFYALYDFKNASVQQIIDYASENNLRGCIAWNVDWPGIIRICCSDKMTAATLLMRFS